jgi:chemotaxis protein histidine kinase CheA
MFTSIEQYLDALKDEMLGSDSALVQDALADAREHLSTALEAARETNPDLNELETLQKLIEDYGTPQETASAYKEVERRTTPTLRQAAKPLSPVRSFFGIYDDPRA